MTLALVRFGTLSLLSVALAGCVTGRTAPAPPDNPMIFAEPLSVSVPMGLTASFTVNGSGSNLAYQWSRNGVAIAGATSNSYTTGATAFSDSGSTFTVVLRNSSGTITSNPALLTVTARAPKAGDLRFQQVDAVSTMNGYAVSGGGVTGCPPAGGGGLGFTNSSGTGIGFFLVNNLCGWQFETYGLPVNVSGLKVGYFGTSMQNYPSILDGTGVIGFPSPSDSGSVITNLIFALGGYGEGLAWIHSDTASGFDRAQYTVVASALQDAVAQEGLRGRVVTAISYDGTNATFFSYGWTGDPSAVYEAKAVFATLDTATSLAAGLANDGYILTTTGQTQAADGSGVILIGTRVKGDTMPRPFLVGDVFAGTVDALFAQGYATVAVVSKLQNGGLVLKNYLGER